MSARTILNPPNNTTLNNLDDATPSVGRSVYTSFTANTPQTVSITFPVAYTETAFVIYTAYSDQIQGVFSTVGKWASNPTTTSTTVTFTMSCTNSESSYVWGIATPYVGGTPPPS
jgi:hypothetical protein